MERIIIVPLRDEGTALPIYATSSPQFTFANSPNGNCYTSYEVVKLTDSNRYQRSPMVYTDIKSD